jgi:CRISPR-associated endonuclease/helicase Cas3
MECFSHPDKKLIDHLKNVKNIGIKVFEKKNIDFGIDKNLLKKTLEFILYYHDIGKATNYFQEYLQNSIGGREYEHSQDLINHSLISACITTYMIKKETDNDFLSVLGFSVIRKHHGNLDNLKNMIVLNGNKINILNQQFNSINCSDFPELSEVNFEDLKDFIKELLWIGFKEDINYYLLQNFLFSILIYSDKTDVVLGEVKEIKLPEDIDKYIDNYKEKEFKNSSDSVLNKIRNEIYNESLETLNKVYENGRIFSLNVPTGSGKTLTALNLAFNMIKIDNSLERVIYALPFTSIVDQTETVIVDVFKTNNKKAEDYLIVHHHLADVKYNLDENNVIEGDKAQFLIENWDKPLILTTFWQLFHTLISNKNSQLRKFHNIANSIIILDEVQTIPYKYWELVKKLFTKLIEVLNCRILFLTATMPLIFQEEKKEIIPLIDSKKRDKYFSQFSRYQINVLKDENNIRTLDLDELFEVAKKDIATNQDKSFLFVFNTIKSSIKFYERIKEEFKDKELIYLSTNILPIERKKRIDKIKDNPNNKIIVSTQLIEAGVDIDLDIVYRDFTPLDSVIQTAGRCNRNNKKESGKIILFKLKNENKRFDYNYIYTSLTTLKTEELFNNVIFKDEKDLLNIINNYYENIKNFSSQNDSKELLISIKQLNYSELDKFKLIENVPSFLIFFEYDDNARKVLSKFREIINIDNRFDRKSEFLKIRSEFYKYVLSVRLNQQTEMHYNSLEGIGNFKIVSDESIDNIYNKEIGFIREYDPFI